MSHDIPFNDESVQNAAEIFGQVMFGDGYVLGGADRRRPSPSAMRPVRCSRTRPAAGCTARQLIGFFPPEAEAGVDYDWFPFPPIDQEGTRSPASSPWRSATPGDRRLPRAVLQRGVAVRPGWRLFIPRPPNINVGPDCYANEILAASSEVTTAAMMAPLGSMRPISMPTEVAAAASGRG